MWTGNSNNDGGEKAQGLADGVQQNERTYITVLYGSKKHQNIKRPKVQSKVEERCANKDLEEFVPADDVQCRRRSIRRCNIGPPPEWTATFFDVRDII